MVSMQTKSGVPVRSLATLSLLGDMAGLLIIPLIATIGYLIKYFFNRGRDKQHSTNLEE